MNVRAVKKENKEDVKKEKNRRRPFGLAAGVPVDDVYVKKFYPEATHGAAAAVDMLKRFQVLDFTPVNQPVYVELRLDMKLEKKVNIRYPPAAA